MQQYLCHLMQSIVNLSIQSRQSKGSVPARQLRHVGLFYLMPGNNMLSLRRYVCQYLDLLPFGSCIYLKYFHHTLSRGYQYAEPTLVFEIGTHRFRIGLDPEIIHSLNEGKCGVRVQNIE